MRANWPNWDRSQGEGVGKRSHRQSSCRVACRVTHRQQQLQQQQYHWLFCGSSVSETAKNRLQFLCWLPPTFPGGVRGRLTILALWVDIRVHGQGATCCTHRQCHRPIDWPRFTASTVVVLVAVALLCSSLASLANLLQLHFDASNRIVPLSQVRCARPKATATNKPGPSQYLCKMCEMRLCDAICELAVQLWLCYSTNECLCVYVGVCVCVGVSTICGVLSVVAVKMG